MEFSHISFSIFSLHMWFKIPLLHFPQEKETLEMFQIKAELRLILMSATLNAELFSSYFGGAPMIHIPV